MFLQYVSCGYPPLFYFEYGYCMLSQACIFYISIAGERNVFSYLVVALQHEYYRCIGLLKVRRQNSVGYVFHAATFLDFFVMGFVSILWKMIPTAPPSNFSAI